MTPATATLGLLLVVAADPVAATDAAPPAADGDATFVDADGDGIDDEAMPPPLPDDGEVLDDSGNERVGETLIGRRRDKKRTVGSAHTIDAAQLERMEADDVHRVLRGVPGVYVRDEDGTGLRPNIGLRGASSDRSAKVTLLEDGVLFGPAPYAAPAAYYFPLTTRMVGVEVWKGPAAIRQGPHTIGGAINLRTRAVPLSSAQSSTGGLDLGFGLVGPGREQTRFHGFAGDALQLGGFMSGWQLGGLVEAARVQSDGFKVIDGQPERPTGFVRDDAMLKLRLMNDLAAAVRHTVELKVGLGREEGFETYLGLSDADLRAAPDRRYAASMDDAMRWVRTQGQLRYGLTFGPAEVDVVAYRHDLDRTWRKVNGVRGAPPLHDVLSFADVGTNPLWISRLQSGAERPDDGAVLIGPNHRTYFSQGVATVARFDLDVPLVAADARGAGGLVLGQQLEVGLRLHQDQIHRDHTEAGFFVVDNALVSDGQPEVQTALNRASATALAVYVADELRLGAFTLVPGLRAEVIGGEFVDERTGGPAKLSQQLALLPGLGVAWAVHDSVSVLGGVHRGFSPVAPGQTGDVRPEESTNAELGVRFDVARQLGLSGEVIGYFSHYDNIVGECTFSAGCVDDTGQQQNGGAAAIWGGEVAVRHALPLRVWRDTDGLRLEGTFTFTQARFLTDFVSTHPLFGTVAANDEMTYVPALQGALVGAVTMGAVDAGLSVGLISAMRDVPGQAAWSAATAHEWTDAQAVVDATVSVEVVPGWRIATRVDNVLDQRAIVSRRPFGARPGKPRAILVSLEADFGT
jgi:Fe(3+) dicitrate transport protein